MYGLRTFRASIDRISSFLLSSRTYIRPPILIELIDSELEEKFIKGGGNGGQALNKAVSCVQLRHIPTGIVIKRFRELCNNRKEARKLMMIALDDKFNGMESKRNLKMEKFHVKRAKSKARSKKKYAAMDKETEEAADETDGNADIGTSDNEPSIEIPNISTDRPPGT